VGQDDAGGHRAHPGQLFESGGHLRYRLGDRACGRFELRVETTDIAHQGLGLVLARLLHGCLCPEAREHSGGLVARQPTTGPTRDDASQQSVEATHRLGVERRQVLVPVPQKPQHGDVVFGDHRPKPWRTECGNGDRERIVGIVLLGLARCQHPHPGRQRRRDVEDLLADADKLL
jgi:hypothetical protein